MKKNTIMIPKMIILEFFGWCREREQRDLCERERERERRRRVGGRVPRGGA